MLICVCRVLENPEVYYGPGDGAPTREIMDICIGQAARGDVEEPAMSNDPKYCQVLWGWSLRLSGVLLSKSES